MNPTYFYVRIVLNAIFLSLNFCISCVYSLVGSVMGVINDLFSTFDIAVTNPKVSFYIFRCGGHMVEAC